MLNKYIPPNYIPLDPTGSGKTAFHCPYCGVFANQLFYSVWRHGHGNGDAIRKFSVSCCSHCSEHTFWHSDNHKIIYPSTSIAPSAHEDMPQDVKIDFDEARQIVSVSPRGAAALLRLCVQKLMRHLGESGEKINDDIGSLVKKGLPSQIQQALDSLRVIGNNAVHPGKIELKDDIDTAIHLFELVNLIIDNQISQPQRIKALYNKLPTDSLNAIERRDGNE